VQLDSLFLLWVMAPLVAVIGPRSVVFDGWWHVYFIYPALLLAVRGVQALAYRWGSILRAPSR